MLWNVILVPCISIALANFQNTQADNVTIPFNDPKESNIRISRAVKRKDYDVVAPSCDQMSHTGLSPFVVLVLFRNSGNFLGLGSIIDKGSILTARRVVENAVYSPSSLLALAGRAGPWWGKNSQVKPLEEIYQSDGDLVLGKIKGTFTFTPNVAPIKLPIPRESPINGDIYAIFGIPRSNIDVPGDPAPKTSMYFVSIEPLNRDIKKCSIEYEHIDFNKTVNFATTANSSYGWGCIGSPAVALDRAGKILIVGVITSTTITGKEICHIYTKLTPYAQWIKSHTIINYNIR